ncbi:hypothetical protein GMSM_20350 [Geomonas sp. Red276]
MTTFCLRPILWLALALFLGGCATARRDSRAEVQPRHTIEEFRDQRFAEVADPWERFNLRM